MRGYLKYLISPEILRPILIILVICLIGTALFGAKVKPFKEKRKKFFIYVLISFAILIFYQIVLHNIQQTNLMFRYYGLYVFFLIAGGMHIHIYRKNYESLGYENSLAAKSIFVEILFSMLTALFLLIPITFVAAYYKNDVQFLSYIYSTVIVFIIPTIVHLLFEASVSIPAKLFTKWFYPLTKKYPVVNHNELKNIIVLDFLFYKGYDEYYLTKFKVKAPKDMNFGRLFYFFIEDYNEKNSTEKIEIFDQSSNPYGWYFYTKPNIFRRTRHIDSELSVENNNLKDNNRIICQRA